MPAQTRKKTTGISFTVPGMEPQDAATVAAILTLPILLIVYFLQRYLRPGALTGAVKG